MRRLGVFLCLPLVLVWAHTAHAQLIDTETAAADAEVFRSYYPRLEGSSGEAEALRFIEARLTRLGLPYERLSFVDYVGGHSFSSVLVATIPGSLPDTALIAVPINHPDGAPPTADGATTLAAALGMAEALTASAHPLTVQIAFLGAEYGSEVRYPMGSRLLLKDLYPPDPFFVLYLDVGDTVGQLTVDTGGAGTVAPAWLVETGATAGEAGSLSVTVLGSLNQLHRLGLSDAETLIVPYLDRGLPALLLQSAVNREASPTISPPDTRRFIDGLGQVVFAMLDRHSAGIPEEWDRHYFFFGVLGRHVVVGEELYLQILLVVLFAMLLYALLFRHRLGRYLRTVARNFWNLPVLFVLVFGLLTAATVLINLFLRARGFPTLWQYRPVAYVALKIALAIFVFLALAQLLRRLPLSKNGSFYSAAAIGVLFADVIIFGVINISYSFFFLWAFACAFLFSVFRSRILKAVALIAAPFWMVRAAYDLLASGQLRLTEIVLQSPMGNLMLSFVVLPFLLMLIRMDFLIRHPVRGKRSFTLRLSTTAAGLVVAAAILYVVQSSPFGPEQPQPVSVTERIDYETFTRRLVIQSPAPLGDMDVEFAGEEYEVSTGSRRWQTSAERLPDVLSVRLIIEDFLDRDRSSLTIRTDSPMQALTVRLVTPTPLLLYDINFPYTMSTDRTTAEVHIGKRPPNPLVVNYTIPRGVSPRIDVEAVTGRHPQPVVIERAQTDISTSVRLFTSIGP